MVKHVKPWEFVFDAAEFAIGDMTRCELRRKQYPLIALRELVKNLPQYRDVLELSPNALADFRIYWDLIGKEKHYFIGNTLIKSKKIEYEAPPFVWLFYKEPIKGAFSDSMADLVYRPQKLIDDITYKIAVAASLSPANTVFIPKGSNLKSSQIAASRIGDVFEFDQTATGAPIVIATPPFIDPSYIELLNLLEQKAYNLVGVSQLSAQAKKPSGLNSGTALQTMEDVESERHQTMLDAYVRFQRDIAERMIDILPDGEEILPKRKFRSSITWKDIKKEREQFSIQFSAASSLSKDPKVKMEQIEKLVSMKVIDSAMAASLLEMPDLESAYSIMTAAHDLNEKIIERVIEDGPGEDGKFYFFECTNVQGLFTQALNTLMRLDANDENPELLENLKSFIIQLKGMMDEINATLQPPPMPEPQQPQAPGA